MTNVKVIFVVLVALTGAARAQGAEAEALFREGRRLVEQGDLPAACAKFEASDRLESTVGSLLNLADCRERTGRLAAAWASFIRAEAAAGRNGDRVRQQEAGRRARALAPRLAYLTISVPASNQVDGLVIERDGVAIDSALWNVSVPVDAGSYEISASAPGGRPWSDTVTLAAGERVSVDVPGFKPVGELIAEVFPDRRAARVAAAPRRELAPIGERSTGGPVAAPRSRMTTLRWAAVGTGTVGLAGIAAGIARGLASRDLQASSDAICGMVCDDEDGRRLNRASMRAASQANVAFVAGGVLTAGAAVLWVVGAPERRTTIAPIAGDRVVGMSLSRRF